MYDHAAKNDLQLQARYRGLRCEICERTAEVTRLNAREFLEDRTETVVCRCSDRKLCAGAAARLRRARMRLSGR